MARLPGARRAAAWTLTATLSAGAAGAQTVGDMARRGLCDSSLVAGLTVQLVETQRCLGGGIEFVTLPMGAGITFTGNVTPLVQRTTRDALVAAAAEAPLQVNSAYRTLAAQYVLYYSGGAGCLTPAFPGTSPHHSGTAVDLQNWSAVVAPMGRHGCRHSYPTTDPVHFDCPGSEDPSWAVRAFQRLWNVNNPGARIAEDGVYTRGGETERALASSPAAGFARGGCGGGRAPRGSVDGVDCEHVTGWALDDDAPAAHVDVDLSFDGAPGAAGATSVRVHADLPRADLCGALGSCDHALDVALPGGLRDGRAHTVQVFARDTSDGAATAVGAARTVTCGPVAPPAGVRRWVRNPDVLAAWRWVLRDVNAQPDDVVAALPAGPDLPDRPVLVSTPGDPHVWMLDGRYKRHVTSELSLHRWRWMQSDVQSRTRAEVDAIPDGPPMRITPYLVMGSGPRVDLVDDALPGSAPVDAGAVDAATSRDVGVGDVSARDVGDARADAPVAPRDVTAGDLGGDIAGDDARADEHDAGPDATTVGLPGPGGCGCRAVGPTAAPWGALAAVAAALARRRRRRGSSAL